AVAFQKSPVDQQGSVVFLTGIYHESSPLICREVMATACKYAAQGQKVYILTGNLKVAGDGLEARYRTSRQAGVTYVKFNTEKPEISQLESGRAVVTFTDEITGHRFRLTPELTVVDEALSVSMFAADAAATLALEQDGDGFVQADNVHRLPVRTNRRGILAVGPSRGVMDLKQQVMDIHNAALACLQHEGSTAFLTPHAEITPGCVRCLTCYRSCPFGAISLNGSLTVVKELCEGCGICAAECPQKVIRMNDLADGSPAEQLVRLKPVPGERATHPVIYAFCCSRSAAQAAALAGVMGRPLPAGLRIIRVPCAGVIATGDILRAFQQKADGVMVLTCHQGNCQAEKGNLHARRRAEGAMVLMEQIGLDKKRLHYATLASNMAHEFGEIVCAFADSLENLYRSFLKG
ncbi:MAG: hydrogenase iron-sulfur subunit, partial [Deltaproteobacteria bacterium]|nr:hydrogenase iron-sulfur subunit [Deltaproteobacteria bacterium]